MSLQSQLKILNAAAASMPTREAALESLDLVARGTPFDELFFSRIADPAWLPLLEEKGYFSALPGPEAGEGMRKTGRQYLPLLGLAGLGGKAPKEVTKIPSLTFPVD